jgi:hypothetical protein
MNDIEILANIFSKSVILKDYMLLWDGREAKAYKEDGEWHLEVDFDGMWGGIPLSDIRDISWGRNCIKINWGGDTYKLQIVQVLDSNQFRFAK